MDCAAIRAHVGAKAWFATARKNIGHPIHLPAAAPSLRTHASARLHWRARLVSPRTHRPEPQDSCKRAETPLRHRAAPLPSAVPSVGINARIELACDVPDARHVSV